VQEPLVLLEQPVKMPEKNLPCVPELMICRCLLPKPFVAALAFLPPVFAPEAGYRAF
jgi:hypothetical protein